MDPLLETPFSMLVVGNSGCGKSTLVARMIRNAKDIFDRVPEHIVICYTQMQDLYQTIQQTAPCSVELIEGLPEDLHTKENTLLVIDDLQGQQSKIIRDWFTKKSHHLATSVIYLVQNLFDKLPEHRTTSLNANYHVIFKNPRDASQISHLAKQVFPQNPRLMVSAYHQATEKPHGYLFVDYRQKTPDLYRLQTHVFAGDPQPPTVFVDEKMSEDRSLIWPLAI